LKNFCYELAKLLYEKVDPKEIHFASHVESVNDLRRALAGLKGLDQDLTAKAVGLIDELEGNYRGKDLHKQVDDIKRNLAGILRLLKRMRGEEIPSEEGEA
jgi:hypothetical protein